MRAYRKLVLRRRVVVNLRSGRAVEGVLVDQTGPLLCLRHGRLHEPGAAAPVPIDGEVVVERVHVDFIQAL